MLQTFRRAKSSWFFLGFLGLVMLGFVFTGIERRGPNVSGEADWVAQIGDETITAPEFNEELSRQLTRLRQEQQNGEVSMAMLVSSGGFDQILAQLISAKAMLAFGDAVGLAVSKKMVDAEIAQGSVFQNAAGQFEDMRLRQWLAANKITEQQLREDLTTGLMQRQLLPPVGSASRTPEGVARSYAALLLETRSGSIGLVPTSAMGAGSEPTDPEIAAYFAKNRARYTIPERRVLRYAMFGRPDVAATSKASEAEIGAAYRANAALYAPKESRTLSQVVLPSRAEADAFAAKIAAGTGFAKAASDAGFGAADTALGRFTKEEFARRFPAAVANVAFAAASGATTDPVQSPLGWHVIRVDAIETTPGRALPAVRDELSQQIEERKAADALLNLVSKIEDEIGGGASFEEVVRAHGLAVQQTPPVTAGGTAPGLAGYQAPAELSPLLKTGFDLSADDEPVVETVTPNQRFALLAVANVVPAAPPPLAAIRERVKADLSAERATARAKAVAASILAKVNAGVPIRQAFAEAEVALPPVQPVKAQRMDIGRQGAQVPPPLRAIFGLAQGKARLLPAPNRSGWFVVRTDEVVAGDVANAPGIAEATRIQLSEVTGREYVEQFARAIEREVEVSRNEPLITRLKSDLARSAAP